MRGHYAMREFPFGSRIDIARSRGTVSHFEKIRVRLPTGLPARPGHHKSRERLLEQLRAVIALKLPNGRDETLILSFRRGYSGRASIAMLLVHVSVSLGHSSLMDCALAIRSAMNTAVFGLTSRIWPSSCDATRLRLELSR
jgi:hypothetical protein